MIITSDLHNIDFKNPNIYIKTNTIKIQYK